MVLHELLFREPVFKIRNAFDKVTFFVAPVAPFRPIPLGKVALVHDENGLVRVPDMIGWECARRNVIEISKAGDKIEC